MQGWNVKKVMRCVAVVIAVGALAIAGCPGDDDDDNEVRDLDVTSSVTTANAGALRGLTFPFANGAAFDPALANTATSLTFNTPSTFTMVAGNAQATGSVAISSCNFTVTASTIPAIPVGRVLRFPGCNFRVVANDVEVGGSSTASGQIFLILVNAAGQSFTSGSVTVNNITILADGTLVINGTITGVTAPTTGTTGSTGG